MQMELEVLTLNFILSRKFIKLIKNNFMLLVTTLNFRKIEWILVFGTKFHEN